MLCPTCNQDLADDIRFCPHDGTPLTDTSGLRTVATPHGGRAPARELSLPVVVGGRYRLEELRGGGGMAKVYRAVDVTLEREVAVKLINPDLRNDSEFDARFGREARIASQLADPHIVVVHDFGIDAELGPFLVMEYLHGQSLRERLEASGPLPLKAGLQLSAQLLLALIHAHGKGIVHRDIKPDNIFLLNQSGVRLHTRVLDFGIARIYRRDDPTGRPETITHAGAVLGTPRYMSPEQLAGQPVDARSDLYSAALVIHEALTKELPGISGKRLVELCPEASPALEDLLEQCLKRHPGERPPTAVEVYLRLQELGKASGILLLPPGAMDRLIAARKANEPTVEYQPAATAKWSRRRWLLAALAGVVALLGVGLAVLLMFFGGSKRGGADGESLLGVKVGDAQGDVADRLKLTRVMVGDPWRSPKAKGLLGPALRPEDLRLEGGPEDLDVLATADRRVCVLCSEGKVCAVVVHESTRGRTAAGLKVGAGRSVVFEKYRNVEVDKVSEGGEDGEVLRCPAHGVAFEVQGLAVTAIALYPPVKE